MVVMAREALDFDKDRVRLIRARLGLTQVEFAEKLGDVNVETVRNWEQGIHQPTKGPMLGKLLAAEREADALE